MKTSFAPVENAVPDLPMLVNILDSLGEAVSVLNTDWEFVYLNSAAAQLSGFASEELIGQHVWKRFPQSVDTPFYHQYHRAMQEQIPIDFEAFYPPRNRWYEVHLQPFPQYLVVRSTNVTARKQAEDAVLQHTQEIETLNARLHRSVQETHHRIKNNLQVVAALVEMQAHEATTATENDHLRRINQHICALAAIHDLLTHAAKTDADPETLSTQEVLGRLIPMLQQTSGNRPISMQIDDIALSIAHATSLSLLVSECVSNAVKHAEGEIEVTLRHFKGQVCLEVCDCGAGFPPDFDSQRNANTGIELIESAARWDLRGEVRYLNREQGGGCVTVTFPFTPIIDCTNGADD